MRGSHMALALSLPLAQTPGKWHGGGHSKKEAGYAVGLE